MSLHPQAAEFLAQCQALSLPRIEQCTPPEIRDNMRAGIVAPPPHLSAVLTRDHTIPTPQGGVAVRVYGEQSSDRLPAIVFYHGGGWVAGDLDTHDTVCRALADALAGVVVSVDYRLAPEHRFPAAAEDAYQAFQWVAQHADELHVDSQRVSVAGDSAGGNLAAVVTLMARDRAACMPERQFLIYPITDCDLTTASYERYAEGHLLTRSAMQWFWDQYQPDVEQRRHPYASPLRGDLQGLPPATVITAQYDVLHDEGQAYAARLQAAGVATELIRYDGMIHGFLHRLHVFDDAQRLVTDVAERALKQRPSSPSV